MKDIINKINKGYLIICFLVIITIATIIITVINVGNNNKSSLTCKRTNKDVDGFLITEQYQFKLKDGKVSSINGTETVKISGKYAETESYLNTYLNVTESTLNTSFNYMNDKDYKITKNNNSYKVEFETEIGIVLNNFSVVLNNDSNLYDLRFNSDNLIASSKNSIKVGDEYTVSKLEKTIESKGYVCK